MYCKRPHIWLTVHSSAAALVWIVVIAVNDGHTVRVRLPEGRSCTWGERGRCSVSPDVLAATSIVFVATALYFFLYAFYLLRSWRQLSKELYQKYRLMNMVVRLQVRCPAAVTAHTCVARLAASCVVWGTGGVARRTCGPEPCEQTQ